jgi:hypothetical protein
MLALQSAGKANLATFLATFCKVRRICHLGVTRAFASRYPLAAREVLQSGRTRNLGHFASHEIPTSGPLAQYSELATANRLVGSSSPPSPTTQSCANGDFPIRCELPRTGGDSCTHFVSALYFVSALENCVSRRRRLALVRLGSNAESVRRKAPIVLAILMCE